MKDLIISTKIKVYDISRANKETEELITKAKEAAQTAYAPYSQYSVGAAILLEDGEITAGSNQENAAYPSGLCAERTALFYTNSAYPNKAIKAIAITAFYQNEYVKDVCTPCGACRQALLEAENRFATPVRIIMCGRDIVYEAESVKSLLPLSFGSYALKTT